MKTEEFIKMYWNQYIHLEKEFSQTLFYLSLDCSNDSAYSQAYSKLILEIGSEIDVIFKEYCMTIDSGFKKSYTSIGRYKESIQRVNPGFITQEVKLINRDRSIKPWEEWNVLQDAPWWWTTYNKVKHKRTSKVEIDNTEKEAYRFANQKYTLTALAGLYQIMVYFYHNLAIDEGKKILTPIPGSRLFKLVGGIWDSVSFYGDSAFYVDDNGSLIWETGIIHY